MLLHLASLVLLVALVGLAVIDARTHRLPDLITLPLLALGLTVNAIVFETLWAPLAGAVLGYGALLSVELAYRRLRGQDGLGRGDAKLFAAGGAWCGVWLLPAVLLVASVSALIFVICKSLTRGRQIFTPAAHAFGPWLAAGIAAGWLYRAYGPGLIP